jgi:hypothetical protein
MLSKDNKDVPKLTLVQTPLTAALVKPCSAVNVIHSGTLRNSLARVLRTG